MVRKLSTLTQIAQKFGLSDALYFLVFKLLEAVIAFRQFEIVSITRQAIQPEYLSLPNGFSASFVTREELLRRADEFAELDLDREFVVEALDRGDACYGIFFEDALVSYGWYSQHPTAIQSDLVFHPGSGYVYMYRGYTLGAFRGKRLHAIGMSHALNHYRNENYQGLISYVERQNFTSLRSIYRLGYKKEGSIFAARALGRYYLLRTGSITDKADILWLDNQEADSNICQA